MNDEELQINKNIICITYTMYISDHICIYNNVSIMHGMVHIIIIIICIIILIRSSDDMQKMKNRTESKYMAILAVVAAAAELNS